MASQISHTLIEPFGVEAKVDLGRGLTEKDKEELRRLTVARFSYEEQYPADCGWFSDLQEARGFGARHDAVALGALLSPGRKYHMEAHGPLEVRDAKRYVRPGDIHPLYYCGGLNATGPSWP